MLNATSAFLLGPNYKEYQAEIPVRASVMVMTQGVTYQTSQIRISPQYYVLSQKGWSKNYPRDQQQQRHKKMLQAFIQQETW